MNCGKEELSLNGEVPSLSATARVLNGDLLSNGGEVNTGDTVDFFIDVIAPVGFNTLLIGGSANTFVTKNDLGVADGSTEVSDIFYRVLTTDSDDGALASFLFVAVDEIGQESDTLQFSFDIEP